MTLKQLLPVFWIPAACAVADSFPPDLTTTRFCGPEVTPSPACLAVSATGEVYVGVDLNGSLGKGPGKGRLVKLTDRDADGVADAHTVFAPIDNPRGLISVGTKVYVLHTAFGSDGKATGMNLAVLEDADRDGVADGPAKVLVSGICSAKSINERGTDHSTNGIRLGIDGWIYIAVGDFGFADATGTDGKKLTHLGGGIVRVRPDGTELELHSSGTRNDYDVAISPFMDCFTRGNTNDGGGWNIRFLHMLQSGEYGYPRLFLNFSTEILPALEDLGGGSGTGALFLSEPSWPATYNNQPLMADWGRKAIYLHRLTVDGPTYTQKAEEFAKVSQVTDLDIDPSGRMFISAWDGAGYKGDAKKGYVVRAVPKDWKPTAFPELSTLTTPALVNLMASPGATARGCAQQELLARPAAQQAAAKAGLSALIEKKALPLEARVAALFTLAQISQDPKALLVFAGDPALTEFALRAATDRLPALKDVALPLAPFANALRSGTPRQQAAAATAMGRLGNPAAAPALLAVPFTKPAESNGLKTPRHATPNSGIVLPHLAAHALVRLRAVKDSLAVLGTPSEDLALWALSDLHEEAAVDGLLARLQTNPTPAQRNKILTTLARLYQQEAAYDGSWWWSTRPDTRGPYYKPVSWSASPRIAAALEAEFDKAAPEQQDFLAALNDSHRLSLKKLGSRQTEATAAKVPTVDLSKISSKKGAVASTPIEDVILSVDKLKPDHAKGEKLFTEQGCVACHALKQGGPALGPYMGQIGSIMNAAQIATAILRPSDSISQGFGTVVLTMKDGSLKSGFVTESTADKLVLRDVAGQVSTVAAADVKTQEHIAVSMMPEGLANALSLDDFAALVQFLASKK